MKRLKKILKSCLALFLAFSTINMSTVVANAEVEEVPFYSESKQGNYDNLFTNANLGDLLVSTIRKQGNNELGFCLAKKKWFPTQEGTLYSSNTDPSTWKWGRGDGTFVDQDIVRQVRNIMYAYHFDLANRLDDYGAEGDTMSLYAANQVALWLVIENLTPNDISIKSDVNDEQRAIAEKQLKMINDLYAARNNDDSSYKTGGHLVNINDHSNDALDEYDITSDKVFTINGGDTYYYRSPLLSLVPNQQKGIVFDGDGAFTYKVELNGAPEGTLITDENSNVISDGIFGLDKVQGSKFYIYVPVYAEDDGALDINVSSTVFKRMDLALWSPVSENAYQDIMKDALVDDTANDSTHLKWTVQEEPTEPGDAKTANICINKIGEQIKSVSTESTEFGDLYKLEWDNLPLSGANFSIRSNQRFTDGLGNTYMKNQELYKYTVTTSDSGKVCWSNIPMAQEGTTSYKIVENSTKDGYVIDNQETIVTIDASNPVSTNTTITNSRIKFDFSIQKYGQDPQDKKPLKDAVFGVYSTQEINGKDYSIPANSLMAILTSDENGNIDGSNLGLPAGQDYVLKELRSPEGYEINSDTFIIKGSEATGSNNIVNVVNQNNEPITEIINIKKEVKPLTPDTIKFNGSKILNGREFYDTDSFKLSFEGTTEGAPLPEKEVVANKDNRFKFEFELIFDETMVDKSFDYVISEVPSGLENVTDDTNQYKYTVQVKKDGDKVNAYIIDGPVKAKTVNNLDFTNIYKEPSFASAIIKGDKVLVNRDWKDDDQFTFELKDLSEDDGQILDSPITVSIKGSDEDKIFEFPELVFNKVGTYKFAVSEIEGKIPNITYDKTTELVTIEVTENESGDLVANVVYEDQSENGMAHFTNTYNKPSIKVTINGSKTLIGRDWENTDKFTFVLTDTNNERPDKDSGIIIDEPMTVQVTGSSKNKEFAFKDLIFTEPGEYKFTVTEEKGSIEDITYDEHIEDVTVKITENDDGTLSSEITYSSGDNAKFTNSYQAPTDGSIKVTKLDKSNNKPLEGVEFTLEYRPDNKNDWTKIETKKTDSKGVIVFKDLISEGEYRLSESVPDGYILESSIPTITLSKTDKDKEITVYNTPVTEKGDIVIKKVDKTSKKPLEGVEFTLYYASDTGLKNPIKSAKTDKEGKVEFTDLLIGKYLVVETKELDNYIKLEKPIEVTLNKDKEVKTITAENELYYGQIKLIKHDADDRNKLVEGAVYSLYNASNDKLIKEGITDSQGEILFDKIPYGKYYIKETTPAEGYLLNDEIYEVDLTDKSVKIHTLKVEDEAVKGKIIIIKTDTNGKKLEGAKFNLYHQEDKDLKNPIATVTTGKDGKIEIKDLKAKEYVLVETEAPKGYIKYSSPIKIDLSNIKDGDVISVTVKNRIEPSTPTPTPNNPDKPNKPIINTGIVGPNIVLYGTVGIASLAVLGGAVYMLIKSKNKKK